MANLTEIFKSEPDTSQDKDKDKLVDLFRNRSELKKEFAALRNEKYLLQDRIKEEQASAARVRQQTDHLEKLLADREWVYSVVAYYQLRRLAALCSEKLANFAEQLKQKREQRAHGALLSDWNEHRAEQAAAVQREIREQRLEVQMLEDRLQAIRQKSGAMNAFMKLFRKRALEAEIAEIVSSKEGCQAKEDELLQALSEIQNLDPPDPAGLDIASKRTINFMILSFVQQLYLHFSPDGLSSMAKEASERSAGAVNYGSKRECDQIVRRIDEQIETLKSVSECADVLQKRAKFIAEHAEFDSDDDVVPTAHSVSVIYAIDANGVVRDNDLSVLGANVFGVAGVLSR